MAKITQKNTLNIADFKILPANIISAITSGIKAIFSPRVGSKCNCNSGTKKNTNKKFTILNTFGLLF